MGLSWVSHSTLIYTSELIPCSTWNGQGPPRSVADICRFQGLVYITQEKFENAAIFLPSTLIPHEEVAFRKRSSNRKNLKTFSVNEKHLKTYLFENYDITMITWFPWPSFSQTRIKMTSYIFKLFWRSEDGEHFMYSLNFSGLVWTWSLPLLSSTFHLRMINPRNSLQTEVLHMTRPSVFIRERVSTRKYSDFNVQDYSSVKILIFEEVAY